MYFIIGILVNRYGRGIESMPELIPNYSFWADVPFLVKVNNDFFWGVSTQVRIVRQSEIALHCLQTAWSSHQ